jgi:hypothetical protein
MDVVALPSIPEDLDADKIAEIGSVAARLADDAEAAIAH